MDSSLYHRETKLFSVFSFIVQVHRKIDKDRFLTSGYSSVGLTFQRKFQNHSVDYCRGYKKSGVTNVADALQQIAGIDVRRRGTSY
jgi:iron complex outermembrane receptor protein